MGKCCTNSSHPDDSFCDINCSYFQMWPFYTILLLALVVSFLIWFIRDVRPDDYASTVKTSGGSIGQEQQQQQFIMKSLYESGSTMIVNGMIGNNNNNNSETWFKEYKSVDDALLGFFALPIQVNKNVGNILTLLMPHPKYIYQVTMDPCWISSFTSKNSNLLLRPGPKHKVTSQVLLCLNEGLNTGIEYVTFVLTDIHYDVDCIPDLSSPLLWLSTSKQYLPQTSFEDLEIKGQATLQIYHQSLPVADKLPQPEDSNQFQGAQLIQHFEFNVEKKVVKVKQIFTF